MPSALCFLETEEWIRWACDLISLWCTDHTGVREWGIVPSQQVEWSRGPWVQILGAEGGSNVEPGRQREDRRGRIHCLPFCLSLLPPETLSSIHLVCHGVCGLNGKRGQWHSPSLLGKKKWHSIWFWKIHNIPLIKYSVTVINPPGHAVCAPLRHKR